jgi:hypothetical protein
LPVLASPWRISIVFCIKYVFFDCQKKKGGRTDYPTTFVFFM